MAFQLSHSMDKVKYSVRAVDRVLRILRSFSPEKPERGYLDIAQETQIPSSTVFKLMSILVEQGFLEDAGGSGRYRIGLEAYRVGCLYLVDKPLLDVAGHWLEKLVERLGMTANLGIREHNAAVRVLIKQGTSPLSLTMRLGEHVPFHTSALGKALILDMEHTELAQAIPPPPWPKYTSNSIVDIQQIYENLSQSRERGYTLDNEEGGIGIRCVGAPIRNGQGEIIAAISVTGTTIEANDEALPEIAQAVQEIALSISEEFGFQPPGCHTTL